MYKVGTYVGSRKNTVKNTVKYVELRYKIAYFTVFLPICFSRPNVCANVEYILLVVLVLLV